MKRTNLLPSPAEARVEPDGSRDWDGDFRALLDGIAWKRYPAPYGRLRLRKEAWYGPVPYRFGNTSMPARALTPLLDQLSRRAEEIAEEEFNSVMWNLYSDGTESVPWHADDEPSSGSTL